jgi:hypothetical protein
MQSARSISVLSMVGLSMVNLTALGTDQSTSLEAPPRQVAHCMLKRMMADRKESYLIALKTCREQLRQPTVAAADTTPDGKGSTLDSDPAADHGKH